ncbi:MAG TPA: 8-amino-7-oxononanoate synthase [Casimicrobiaceae bacterium]|nr:8-amino-7-oxononanoate synthase [Casimicrobiaceae bacterium]
MDASALIERLERQLAARAEAGLTRARRTIDSAQAPRLVVDGEPMLSFASNDYLGLASDSSIVAAAQAGAARWGVGAGASHLVCGHQTPHAGLERRIASYVAPCAASDALLVSSGYLANLAILTTLADRETTIFADRLNHACLNDGALLSRAELVRYPHADVDALSRSLAASKARHKVIATDAVFSMDGDIAPLPALLELSRAYDAWLVVDDAHGFGVLGQGRGTPAHFALEGERIVLMGTLGKAAGVAGAFIAAHRSVIESIVQFARPYIYTTAAPALLACALEAALDTLARADDRRVQLAMLIERLHARLEGLRWRLLASRTPIQPLVVGGNETALALSAMLRERGIFVPAIRPPTVPEGTARLRISLSSAHSFDDVDELAEALWSAS